MAARMKRAHQQRPKECPYMKFYKENCQEVNARYFTEVKKQALRYLSDEKCPMEVKILIGEWLFSKIYRMFHFTEDGLKHATQGMIPPIGTCQQTIPKSSYLQYTNTDATNEIALHYYFDRFKHQNKFFILQLLNDTQLAKNYIQDSRINDEELRQHFIAWLKKSGMFEQQSNILDVLLRYYAQDQEVQEVYQRMRFGKKGKGTVYDDEQNVHDEALKQSSTQAAQKLIEWAEKPENAEQVPEGIGFKDYVTNRLYRMYHSKPEYRPTIDAVVERMCIDTTNFGSGFSIARVFLALLTYIARSKSKTELRKRLIEEMEGMKTLCSSGYITRYMNVLQGFDDRYAITISVESQLYAVISKKLADAMSSASENVVAGAYEEDHREEYLIFVSGAINSQLHELINSYGEEDVKMNLVNVLLSITGFDVWTWNNFGPSISYKTNEEEEEEDEML